MIVALTALIVAGVAAPLFAYAWAMQSRGCPHCGQAIEPDPVAVRAFTGN